jgi:hypothetical protein
MNMTGHQRIAFLLAFMVMAAGVVGIIGREMDDETSSLTISSPSPTTSPPAASAMPVATASTAPTAAPTMRAPATPAPITAPPNGAANKPQEGVYTYKETGDGRFTQSTLRITNTGGAGQKEGQGDVVSDVTWRSDGKYTHRVIFGTPPNTLTCDLEPDLLEIKLPLQSGAVWTIRSSCEFAPGVILSFTGTGSVLGTERVTVGGTQADTSRIKSDITVRGEGDGETVEQKIVTDGLFAPGAGLFVRISTQISGTDPFTGEPSNSSTVQELVSLTPQPA